MNPYPVMAAKKKTTRNRRNCYRKQKDGSFLQARKKVGRTKAHRRRIKRARQRISKVKGKQRRQIA